MRSSVLSISFFLSILFSMDCHPSIGDEKTLSNARRLMDAGKYHLAIARLSMIIGEGDSLETAYRLRAKCYSALQLNYSAKMDLMVLQGLPSNCSDKLEDWNSLETIFQSEGDWDSSSWVVGQMIHEKRGCPHSDFDLQGLCLQRAYSLCNANRFLEARATAEESKQLGASSFEIALLYSYIHRMSGKTDSALFWMTSAIARLDSIDAKYVSKSAIYKERGDLNQIVEKPDSACADWQRASSLGSEEAAAKLDSFCSPVNSPNLPPKSPLR